MLTTGILAWEKSRHFATPPLASQQNEIWGMSAEIPYRWRVNTQIWVVLLIGCNLLHPIRSTTQIWVVTHHQCGKSALLANTSFRGETSGGVVKSRLFSQVKGIYEFLTTFHALLKLRKISRLSKYHGMSDTFATYMVRWCSLSPPHYHIHCWPHICIPQLDFW